MEDFVDIRALARLNAQNFGLAAVIFQGLLERSLGSSRSVLLDPGSQAFTDGVPFLVEGFVDAGAAAGAFDFASPPLVPSDAESASLDLSSITVTDRQGNLITNYTLTFTDIPEPATFPIMLLGLISIVPLRRLFSPGR